MPPRGVMEFAPAAAACAGGRRASPGEAIRYELPAAAAHNAAHSLTAPPETLMTRPALLSLTLAAGLLCAGSALAQTAAPAKKPAAKAPAAKPLAPADEAQLTAAKGALLGDYDCEFGEKAKLGENATAGYLDVAVKGKTHTMKPVLSSTGALRLEDVTGRTLWLQIGDKSMLMDTKAGQRLVDKCVHPEQAKVRAAS